MTTSHVPLSPPPVRPQPSLGPYLPLLAAVLEIPWFLMVVVPEITAGARTLKGADPGMIAMLMIVPALVGIAAGIVLIARGRARSPGQRVALAIGLGACGLIVLASVWDRLT